MARGHQPRRSAQGRGLPRLSPEPPWPGSARWAPPGGRLRAGGSGHVYAAGSGLAPGVSGHTGSRPRHTSHQLFLEESASLAAMREAPPANTNVCLEQAQPEPVVARLGAPGSERGPREPCGERGSTPEAPPQPVARARTGHVPAPGAAVLSHGQPGVGPGSGAGRPASQTRGWRQSWARGSMFLRPGWSCHPSGYLTSDPRLSSPQAGPGPPAPRSRAQRPRCLTGSRATCDGGESTGRSG